MEIIGVLLVVAAFLSFAVLEKQNVQIKASLKRIEEEMGIEDSKDSKGEKN